MFGYKSIYKVTNLKVHSKGRYLVFFKFLFKNYSEWLVWTTKLFSSICNITNCKSHLLKFDWLAGGENAWLSSARFKTCAGVFISLYFWWMSFSFHLACNVWKSGVCEWSSDLCTLSGETSLSTTTTELICIYAATSNASLWDYGINKFNCIKVSVQFML